MTTYQYNNKGMKPVCMYCGKLYEEHGEGLKCPAIQSKLTDVSLPEKDKEE